MAPVYVRLKVVQEAVHAKGEERQLDSCCSGHSSCLFVPGFRIWSVVGSFLLALSIEPASGGKSSISMGRQVRSEETIMPPIVDLWELRESLGVDDTMGKCERGRG